MLNRSKNLNPLADLLKKKQAPSHRVRNGLIGTGIAVAAMSLLTKKKVEQ